MVTKTAFGRRYICTLWARTRWHQAIQLWLASRQKIQQSHLVGLSRVWGTLIWSFCPYTSLSPLQQGVHMGERVGIAFQGVYILFGLQFNLQSDAVRIVEVESLAIPPFDSFGHRW